ncbi:MAG: DUF3105 domain-containing protein [Actinomycetota bacterium]
MARQTGRTEGPTGDRPTKAQRKEEARRQRMQIERRMARSRRNRWIALGVAVALAAGATAFLVTRPRPEAEDPAELLAAAPHAAQAAGCDEVRNVGPYQPPNLDAAHIGAEGGPATMPPLSTYPSVPPASGPHAGQPLAAGVYSSPPPIDLLVHSLEHGAAIVWYAPETPDAEVTRIEDFYGRSDAGSRVIVAPFDYPDQGPAGSLPADTEMALVAWHNVESCSRANLAAAFGFTARYVAPPFDDQDYLGEAPEPGAPF